MHTWQNASDGGSASQGRLSDFLVELTSAEMDLPHIVLCKGPRGATTSYSGPYATAIEALVAADAEQQIERAADGREALTFHVAALYPALPPALALDGRGDPR